MALTDTFTGTNGDPPSTINWTEADSSNVLDIQSNKLDFDSQDAVNDIIASLTSNFYITGDFDIQIDLAAVDYNVTTASLHYAQLRVFADAVYSNISMIQGGASQWAVGGSSTGYSAISRSVQTSKLRITRVGSTIKGYYWTGAQWEWNGNTSGFTFSESHAGNAYVYLYFKQENTGPRWHVTVDNLSITGTAVFSYIEDFSLDLAVQANAFDYFKMILQVLDAAWVEDFKLNLDVVAQMIDSFKMLLEVVLNKIDDFRMLLEVTDGTVFDDFAMLLNVVDGTVFDNFKMELSVVSATPAFRSVTAHRVSSVLHEVV